MSLAGCLGSDDDTPEDDGVSDESDDEDTDSAENDENGEEGDDEGEQSEPTEAEDAEEEDESESEQTDSEADTEDGENGTDEAQEIRPSDLDIAPEDAWDDDHPDVEVPDEPGRAVLVVDGRRVEMVGDLTGGPRSTLYEAIIEDDEFAGDGLYFFADGLFEPTDEALEEHGWETGHQLQFRRRMVGWSGNSLSYRNSDDFVIGWPNILQSATYYYSEDVDGSIVDGDLAGRTYAEEPFLRIDRAGVVTATGTIEDSGNSDVPEGATFEFGARAQEEWVEQLEDD